MRHHEYKWYYQATERERNACRHDPSFITRDPDSKVGEWVMEERLVCPNCSGSGGEYWDHSGGMSKSCWLCGETGRTSIERWYGWHLMMEADLIHELKSDVRYALDRNPVLEGDVAFGVDIADLLYVARDLDAAIKRHNRLSHEVNYLGISPDDFIHERSRM